MNNTSVKGYEKLEAVLVRAYNQAARGKGKERHANDLPFHEQPMQSLIRAHGIGFATGQACKKAEESLGLSPDHAIAELLGAINYLAGAVIAIESRQVKLANDNELPRCPCLQKRAADCAGCSNG